MIFHCAGILFIVEETELSEPMKDLRKSVNSFNVPIAEKCNAVFMTKQDVVLNYNKKICNPLLVVRMQEKSVKFFRYLAGICGIGEK